MDVEWDVVGFSIGQVGAVSQVEGDVKKIHNLFNLYINIQITATK